MQIAKEFESEIKAPHTLWFSCPWAHPPATSSPSLRRLSVPPPACRIQCSASRTRAATQEPGQFRLEVRVNYVQILPSKITKHLISASSVNLNVC